MWTSGSNPRRDMITCGAALMDPTLPLGPSPPCTGLDLHRTKILSLQVKGIALLKFITTQGDHYSRVSPGSSPGPVG